MFIMPTSQDGLQILIQKNLLILVFNKDKAMSLKDYSANTRNQILRGLKVSY